MDDTGDMDEAHYHGVYPAWIGQMSPSVDDPFERGELSHHEQN